MYSLLHGRPDIWDNEIRAECKINDDGNLDKDDLLRLQLEQWHRGRRTALLTRNDKGGWDIILDPNPDGPKIIRTTPNPDPTKILHWATVWVETDPYNRELNTPTEELDKTWDDGYKNPKLSNWITDLTNVSLDENESQENRELAIVTLFRLAAKLGLNIEDYAGGGGTKPSKLMPHTQN